MRRTCGLSSRQSRPRASGGSERLAAVSGAAVVDAMQHAGFGPPQRQRQRLPARADPASDRAAKRQSSPHARTAAAFYCLVARRLVLPERVRPRHKPLAFSMTPCRATYVQSNLPTSLPAYLPPRLRAGLPSDVRRCSSPFPRPRTRASSTAAAATPVAAPSAASARSRWQASNRTAAAALISRLAFQRMPSHSGCSSASPLPEGCPPTATAAPLLLSPKDALPQRLQLRFSSPVSPFSLLSLSLSLAS